MLSAPARYFDLVREMKNAYNHRLLELVIGLAVFPLVFVSHGGADVLASPIRDSVQTIRHPKTVCLDL